MKKITLLSASLALVWVTSNAQTLYYVEKSTNLNTSITWEKGWTNLDAADLNNDGHLDIGTIGDHGAGVLSNQKGIMVWFGNGQGAWTGYKTGNFGYGGITFGDVNNDGNMDCGIGMHHPYGTTDFGDQTIEVHTGNGTGQSWTPYDDGDMGNYTGPGGAAPYGMFGVDFGDMDNDGLLDLAGISFGYGDGVHIYKNNGNGTWTETENAPANNNLPGNQMIFADVNQDKNLDLIMSYYGYPVIFGKGDGTFVTPTYAGMNTEPFGGFSAGDIDGDGMDEVAFVDSSYGIRVFKWQGSSTSNIQAGTWIDLSANLPKFGYDGTAIADMNQDGFNDIIAFSKAANVDIFLGNGGTSYTQDVSTPTAAGVLYSNIVCKDFTHDGYPDILLVTGSSTKNNLQFFEYALNPTPTLGITSQAPLHSPCYAPGQVTFLEWAGSAPTGTSATVKIEYSTSGANGPWTTIVSSTPNDGSYQWTVPTGVNSNNCHIKYTITGSGTASSTSKVFGIGDCSTFVGIEKASADNALNFGVYPNPANNKVMLTFNGNMANVSIVNVIGQQVASFTNVVSKQTLDIASLNKGVYFVNLTVNEVVYTQKLIVE